jgi:hypothetical protein
MKESNINALSMNKVMVKVEDLYIKQEFINDNYKLVTEMVNNIEDYKNTVNEIAALNQSIFTLNAQAIDHEYAYRVYKIFLM